MPVVPTERAKVSLPPYVIDPPDVLQIDALRLVPRSPYKLSAFDEIGIRFPALPDIFKKEDLEDLIKSGRTIAGPFTVEPEGTVNLGPLYGRVNVLGLTVDQARAVVEARLKEITKKAFIEEGKVCLLYTSPSPRDS